MSTSSASSSPVKTPSVFRRRINQLKVNPHCALEFSPVSDQLESKMSQHAGTCLENPPVGVGCQPQGWADLPEHLLLDIFRLIPGNTNARNDRKNTYSVMGVCSSWRRVGQSMFCSEDWSMTPNTYANQHSPIKHMVQLFKLSPQKMDDGGLMRCFLIRKRLRNGPFGPIHAFVLYGGQNHVVKHPQFLMYAEQTSRTGFMMSVTKDELGEFALLDANVLRTRYTVDTVHQPWVRQLMAACGHCVGPLGSVQLAVARYHMRMKSLMLPRRLQVELVQPDAEGIHDNPLFGSRRFSCAGSPDKDVPVVVEGGDDDASASDSDSPRAPADLDVSSLVEWPSPRPGSARERNSESEPGTGTSPRGRLSSSGGSATSYGCSSSTGASSTGTTSVPVIRLQNKAPHWNEQMKCWCLNFRGRVRMPSVKNFQLTHASDPEARVLMQFGKVNDNTFVLDFNPCIVTTVQAFAIALSSFERKYCL